MPEIAAHHFTRGCRKIPNPQRSHFQRKGPASAPPSAHDQFCARFVRFSAFRPRIPPNTPEPRGTRVRSRRHEYPCPCRLTSQEHRRARARYRATGQDPRRRSLCLRHRRAPARPYHPHRNRAARGNRLQGRMRHPQALPGAHVPNDKILSHRASIDIAHHPQHPRIDRRSRPRACIRRKSIHLEPTQNSPYPCKNHPCTPHHTLAP